MREMVERVAKAIERTMFADHELPITGELHDRYLETARAAIKAMREPTEDMVRAARYPTYGDSHSCWETMIDAALAKAPSPAS